MCSSSQSGFSFQSTQSAPAISSQPTAQSRLNDFYEHLERETKQESNATRQGHRLPPRPFSSSNSRGARGQGASKRPGARPGAKAKSKARQNGPSLDETRRARILHMQRLYGLAGDDSQEENPIAALPPAPVALVASESNRSLHEVPPAQRAASPAPVVRQADADSFTPDFDRALSELRASMVLHEDVRDSFTPETNAFDDPSHDPLGLSLTAGSSGGLIAWSKNLKPEELSSDVTLESLLRPL